MKSLLRSLVLLLLSLVLAACFGSGGGGSGVATYTIGGTVTGLEGSGLVLQNNGGDDITININSDFTFAARLTNESDYNVTVLTQPSLPSQTCTITNGSGTLSGSNITDISVACVTNTYTIGGSTTGLSGSGLVLQNNGGDNFPVTTGSFTFATAITDGTDYSVTVLTQPSSPNQMCSVTNGSGTLSGSNITNVSVTCITNTYTIGGSITGLVGSGLVLQNNDIDDLPVITSSFTFDTAITDGTNYNVTVLNQPTGQTCTASNASGTVAGVDVTNVTVTCSKVSPLYSTNGFNWNDYVQGGNITNATDTACNADTDTACLHGGEIRMVELTSETSCTGFTASDALGAFNWTCDNSTGTPRIISSGFTSGYGLVDLLNFATPGWNENSLTIYKDSIAIETTSAAVWWSNPVVVNTTGGALGAAGTVYVVPSNTTAIYSFGEGSISLVAAPEVVINGPAGCTTCSVIRASSVDFLWLEGMVANASGLDKGIYWSNVRFSVMHDLKAGGANGDNTGIWKRGILLASSSNNRLSGVTSYNNSVAGIELYSYSDNNTLSGIITSNNNAGVNLTNSHNNQFYGVTASNNSQAGIHISAYSDGNILAGVTASNNGSGIYVGHQITPSKRNTFMGVSASNNKYSGVQLDTSTSNIFANVATSNNGGYSLSLSSSSSNYFTGELKIGSNCYVYSGTNPGLVHSTCANQGSSDATLSTGISLANSFVAKITADDSANTSDTNGAAAITDITQTFDWTSFENPYRNWGVDGSTFPNDTNRRGIGCPDYWFYTNQTDCEANSEIWRGDARIWDWSLLSTDTVIKDVLTLPTGNDTLTHTWSDASTSTILRNAVEIMDDGIGNDNTLCETGETCLYTPNMGSYQGHGNLISAGSIGTGGTLENIILMKYETNGY